MRNEPEFDAAIEMLDNRIEDGGHPIIGSISQAKRETLKSIRKSETTTRVVDENCDAALRSDIDFPSFLRVQAARNAAAWAAGDLDRI